MSQVYVVTGGAGFIGSNIVRALLNQNRRVRVFDNFSTGHRQNVADLIDDVELVEGDLRSIDACRRAVRGATYVLHQAALPSVSRSIEDPQTSHEVNATGTLNLLIAAREVSIRRIVYASSSSVYGPDGKLPRVETDRPHPASPYAVSKLCGEHHCAAFFHSYGLETVALRYFNVFGPRQQWDSPYAAVLPKFIRALRRHERPTIFGDGNQTRDFTFVDNVVDANLKALEAAGAAGMVYNVGAGQKTSVNELLHIVASSMGVESNAEYCAPRAGDVRDSMADITRAATDLCYQPLVSVEEGLKTTLAWALGNGA